MRPNRLPLTIGSLVLLAAASAARGEMLFYSCFDRHTNADFAVGDPRGLRDAGSSGRFELAPGRGDRWGKSLDASAGQQGKSLRYAVGDNIDFTKGTIEFFARIDEYGENMQEHRFFVASEKSYANVLALGIHPQGKYVICRWQFNDKANWFHVEKVIKLKQWHHYAVTWDVPGAAGKGTLGVYIDGKRCAETTGLAPFDVAPRSLHVACGPKGAHALIGQLDDLAVFNDVRYTKDFAARPHPLTDEGGKAVKAAKAAIAREVGQARAKTLPDGTGTDGTVVTNGGFEQWADDKPVGWELSQGFFSPDTGMKVAGGKSLRMAPDRMQKTRWLCTEARQKVTLRPHTDYKLRFWAAKEGTGRVRASLQAWRGGKPSGKPVLSYTTGWTGFFVWTPIEAAFRTSSSNAYELRVLQFGDPTAPVWLDEVVIEEVGGQVALPTPADLERGFQLFSHSVMLPFDEQSAPAPGHVVEAVRIVLAKGEYEPGLVAIRAIRNLRDVDLQLAGDLTGPGGVTLSKDSVAVRQFQDPLLPPSRPRFANRAANLAWWVTVRTTADSPAGGYTGTLRLMTAGEIQAEIPLQVDVLDLVLPEPDIAYCMYHAEVFFPGSEFLTEAMRRAYYRDMREHGMNTVTVYNNPDVDGRRVDLDHNYANDPRHFDADAFRKLNLRITAEDNQARFNFGLSDVMPLIRESGLCGSGQPVMWLVNKMGYAFGEASEGALRGMLDEWLKRKWPTPLLYVHDEPSDRERIDAVKPVLQRIKAWKLPVKTVTAGLDIEELGALYDVWVLSESQVGHEALLQAKEHGAEIWTYSCSVPPTNAPFARALCGLWAWRSGVKGVAQWVYYGAKDWYMDEEGIVHGSNRHSRICPSAAGPVPTVAWEAAREGIDDYRYAMLFGRLLRQAEQLAEELAVGAATLLTDEDAQKIEQREKQLETKFDPEAPKADWRAADKNQIEGERMILAARRLRRELDSARRVYNVVIMAIPLDAMATRAAIPFNRARATYCPVLGLGDPRTVAENKRRSLVPYMLRLKRALEQTPLAP